MITIDSAQKITMFNGDTGHFTINITKNGVPVVLTTGDTLSFSVKKNVADVTYSLQKVVTSFEDGAAVITLDPSDTIDLDPNIIENVINEDFPYYFYDLESIHRQ